MSDSTVTEADTVRHHFRRQESVRVEYRKYDYNRRLKDALKARIQPYHDAKYEQGDLIIFQDANDQWTGPAEVKTTESKTLFVLHNGQLKKVATCRARPWIENTDNEESDSGDEENDSELDSDQTEITEESQEEPLSSSRMEIMDASDELLVVEDTQEESSSRMENQGTSILAESVEKRPKRGAEVIFQKAGENVMKSGRIKHVGKNGSKKKNTCWVEVDGNIEELDFLKEVTGWKYKEKGSAR